MGRVSICTYVPRKSMFGRSPPPSSFYVGTLLSFCNPPFVTSVQSFSCIEGFGIRLFFLGFLIISLPPVSFVFSISFLVFFVGLFDFCEVPYSSCFLPFDPFLEAIGTLHPLG
jgi:hypothetical protein